MLALHKRPFKKKLDDMKVSELKYLMKYLDIDYSLIFANKKNSINLIKSDKTDDELNKILTQINIITKNHSYWLHASYNYKSISRIKSYSKYNDVFKIIYGKNSFICDYSIIRDEWTVHDETSSYLKSKEYTKYRNVIIFLEAIESLIILNHLSITHDICSDITRYIGIIYCKVICFNNLHNIRII